MTELSATLAARGSRYGTFLDNATISQDIKLIMRASLKWNELEADQKESLDLIASKIGRILSGDVNYIDSWHDIAGYAKLIEMRLNGDPV